MKILRSLKEVNNRKTDVYADENKVDKKELVQDEMQNTIYLCRLGCMKLCKACQYCVPPMKIFIEHLKARKTCKIKLLPYEHAMNKWRRRKINGVLLKLKTVTLR